MTNRQLFIVISLLLLAGPLLAQQSASDKDPLPIGSATVAESKGEVYVRIANRPESKPTRGMYLPAGTTIQTKAGSILLHLQDGSLALVRENSMVTLKAPDEGNHWYLELLLGKLKAEVKKRLGDAPSFRLGTPTAVITVRGTRFIVEVDKNKSTLVDVYDGIVEVVGSVAGAESHPVLVETGFSTEVMRDHFPDLPRELRNMTDLENWDLNGEQNRVVDSPQ